MPQPTPPPLTGFSIRTNVMLLTLLPMLSMALVVSIAFVSFRINDLEHSLRAHGEDSARHLAMAAEFGVITGNRTQLQEIAQRVQAEPDVRSVSVHDAQRRRLVLAGPTPVEEASLVASMGDAGSLLIREDIMRFAEPVRLAGVQLPTEAELLEPWNGRTEADRDEPLGWVVVELSRTRTELAKYRTAFIALLTTLGAISLSYWLARHLSNRIALPIASITEAIGDIRDGKLNTRVAVQGGPEIDLLQDGVNSMAEALGKLRSDMQQNIDQATEDLRETLETIEIQNIELDIARKDALEASRVKSEFLANMSHEIRTPLNGIIGFTRLLLKSRLTRQQKDQLYTILKSSEILLTIINDILDFSKIEAGKLVLDYTPVHLQDVIDDVLTMLAPAAHEKNLDLAALVYADTPRWIYGDPLRLKQVVTNLVNNAIKFTQTGDVMLRVMLDDDDQRGRPVIRLTVTDTGVGLSRLQQQSLFTPFTQADASTARRHGGTGLGLVISRRLVEQMGGRIGVDSELGKGATFWVTLPVEICTPTGEQAPDEAFLHGERLIYFDTQEKTALVVESNLRLLGARVDRVATLAELVERVQQAQQAHDGYAMAIIGVSQPQLTTPSLTQQIHALEIQLDCRTLVLLPTLDPMSEEPAFLQMASATLTKPASRRKLAETTLVLLKGRNLSEPAAPSAALTVKSRLDAPQVLAVDDNAANLKLIIALLNELKVRVEGVSSGYEALRAVRAKRYDLIFMDVQMPGMDGIETTARIREIEGPSRHTPVVALTAHALAEERRQLMRSGFDDYLTKPVDERLLREVIHRRTGFACESDDAGIPAFMNPTIKPSSRMAAQDCFDYEASVSLAGGKLQLAEELFSMLLESLPEARRCLMQWASNDDRKALLEEVHKLHGATRYCGVPRLRQAAAQLETALKRNTPDAADRLSGLLEEIERLEYWAERNDWQEGFRSLARRGE